MNWVDILVLVVLGLAGYRGFKSGLIRMGVFLLVMAVGLAMFSRLSQPIGRFLLAFVEEDHLRSIATFIVLIVLLMIAAEIISRVLVTVIKFLPFAGLANSLAGMGIGLLVGFVVLSALLTGLQKFPFGGIREDIAGSPLGSFMADNFDVVIRGIKLIPGDWDDKASQLKGGFGSVQERGNTLRRELKDWFPNPEHNLQNWQDWLDDPQF